MGTIIRNKLIPDAVGTNFPEKQKIRILSNVPLAPMPWKRISKNMPLNLIAECS